MFLALVFSELVSYGKLVFSSLYTTAACKADSPSAHQGGASWGIQSWRLSWAPAKCDKRVIRLAVLLDQIGPVFAAESGSAISAGFKKATHWPSQC